MKEWEVPFVGGISPASRVDAGVASLGRRICWPFLTRPIGGFSFPILSPSAPTNIPSFSNLVYRGLLLSWDFLGDIVCPCFSNNAKNILFTAAYTVAFLDGRPSSGIFCFGLFFIDCFVMCSCSCPIAQPYPTLCDPLDHSPPDSSVHGVFRQEYWSGLPYPPPGGLPNSGIEAESPVSPALKVDSFICWTTGEAFCRWWSIN